MTKTKNGCLKILVCAGAGSDPSGGSDPESDAHADESKAVSDKSRWSFRRRSTRHRVLKNSDISEPETLSSSKAKAEIVPSNNAYSSAYSYASEKPLHLEKPDVEKPDEKILHQEKPDEKPPHEEQLDEKPTEKPTEEPSDQIIERSIELPDEKIADMPSEEPAESISEKAIEEPTEQAVEKFDEKPDESISVSSTELKQDEDPEEDHVESGAVVIESGITTYDARQELSDHKDLVKLQAVIRGHLVRRQAAESLQCVLAIAKTQGLVRAHQAQQDTLVSASSEKLLQNGFALKLMDSMSRSKSMNIKCDPSETDATWIWMERWTTLILPGTGGHLLENTENSGSVVEKMEEDAQDEEKVVPLDSDISFPKLVPDDVEDTLGSSDSRAFVEETIRPSDSSGLEAPECVPEETSELEINDDTVPEKVSNDAEQLADSKAENAVEQSLEFSGHESSQTDPSREPIPLPEKSESWVADIMDTPYNVEQSPEMEVRSAARKACNPAFAAAQMKFAELTSAVSRSNSSSYLDGASKLKVQAPHSQDGTSPKENGDTGVPESAVGRDAKVILAASECGTEISISSTLDSPDRSEADGGEIVMEIGDLGGRKYAAENGDEDAHVLHSEDRKISEGVVVQAEKEEEVNGDAAANHAIASDPTLEQAHAGSGKPDLHDQIEQSTESYARSPEGTPASRTTFLESHGTPSSEVSSVNTTSKSKSKKPKSRVSRRSLTSPSNSVGRSSTDNLSKDYKHAKREGSAAKSDNVDQEPRMSNSTPLPSYMQFTESARAKAAALSPKMSPDVQEGNPRKRHSLPIANGSQETSPRMQRSSSQAQEKVKSSVAVPVNPSSDKRWNI